MDNRVELSLYIPSESGWYSQTLSTKTTDALIAALIEARDEAVRRDNAILTARKSAGTVQGEGTR